jgi:hypothetical protein
MHPPRGCRCSSKRAPGIEELQALLVKIIPRILRLLTRQALLIAEEGMALGQPLRYLAEPDADNALTPLQAASCTYRIALGHAQDRRCCACEACRGDRSMPGLCANLHGFSLVAGLGPHAAVRCGADERSELVHLCSITTTAATSARPARQSCARRSCRVHRRTPQGTQPSTRTRV